MAIVSTGRPARTDFMRLARFDSVDLLRAHLHTGRTHQIRVHLASVGHPVVGDDTYGGGGGRRLVKLPPRRHFLHAAWLRFRHPVTGEPVDLRSPLPPELRDGARRERGGAGRRARSTPTRWSYFGFYRRRSLSRRRPTRDAARFAWARTLYGCDIDAVREIIPVSARDAPARRAGVRPAG